MFAFLIRSPDGDQIRSPARTFPGTSIEGASALTGLRLAHAFPVRNVMRDNSCIMGRVQCHECRSIR